MKIHLMRGYALLEHVDPVAQRSGLALPSTVQTEERRTGRIVALGDPELVYSRTEKRLVEQSLEVSVGEYAVFKKHSADVLSIGGRSFFRVKVTDILGVTDSLAEFQRLTPQ
jgi:co-chaperonin GroES (HSP10)